MIGLNCPAEVVGQVELSDPLLAIVHDDFAEPLKPFAGLNVLLWRPMSPRSQLYHSLPPNAHVVNGNEADSDWPTWYATWASEVRAARPDIVIHHPASNVNGEYLPTAETLAACDVLDVHVPSWANQANISDWLQSLAPGWSKPWWVTEVEVPPDALDQFALLMDAARACLAAGAEHAFLWGADYSFPDVLNHPDILAEVRQFNQGAQGMATDPAIQQVLDQNALIADALYDLTRLVEYLERNGSFINVPDLTASLQDAKTKVNALNPEKFPFP